VSFCNSCNRIASKSTSNGSSKYKDGRIICGYCNQAAVGDEDAISRSRIKVQSQLQSVGIPPAPPEIPIRLADQTFLKKKLQQMENPKGYTHCNTKHLNGKLISKEQIVYILTGQPPLEFEGILAHEFMRVWLNQQNITMSGKQTEGFCNLGAMLIYQADKSKLAEVLLDNMEKDDDPAYGDGYRMMRDKLQKLGWSRLIQKIKQGKL